VLFGTPETAPCRAERSTKKKKNGRKQKHQSTKEEKEFRTERGSASRRGNDPQKTKNGDQPALARTRESRNPTPKKLAKKKKHQNVVVAGTGGRLEEKY